MTRRRTAFLLTVFFVATLGSAARADDRVPKTESARLKNAADVLMDDHRYADALALYVRAHDLSGDAALLYNEGRAHEALGEYPEALEALERFDHDATPALRARVPGLHDLMEDLRGRIATLVVRTNAPNARLLVREKAAGAIAGETRVRTRAGTATIEVDADGYEPFRREVDLAPRSTLDIDAMLVLKKRDALVVVRTDPSSDVTIDGRPIGRSPLEVHLAPGPHDLACRAPGYDDEKITMTLALGDQRDVDLELRKTPGIMSKWWFWTTIGVVVVGGVVATYALTTEKAPSSGSFNPGKIPGP